MTTKEVIVDGVRYVPEQKEEKEEEEEQKKEEEDKSYLGTQVFN